MSEAAVPGTVPRYVRWTQWIWLVGSVIAVLSGAGAAVVEPGPLLWAMVGISVVQAAIAVPAAVLLPRGKRWARTVLLVLALLSLASLSTALQQQAWASLVLNVVLAATYGLLQDPSARPFFDLPAEPWLRRKLRGTS